VDAGGIGGRGGRGRPGFAGQPRARPGDGGEVGRPAGSRIIAAARSGAAEGRGRGSLRR
jgi:ribonuclease R